MFSIECVLFIPNDDVQKASSMMLWVCCAESEIELGGLEGGEGEPGGDEGVVKRGREGEGEEGRQG